MNDSTTAGPHWSFWVIAALALLWNAMGIANYITQMNPEALASYPDTHRAIVDGRPVWATGGFAVAVFGGALGCLLLLLRKSAAFYLLIASLAGTVVTMIHTVSVVRSTSGFGPVEIAMMMVMPLLVAALLVWYSKYADAKGWIGSS